MPYNEEDDGGGHASHPRGCLSWLLTAVILCLHPSVGPSTSYEFSMPAQRRGRRDQEHRPALPRQESCQRGQDESIGGGTGAGQSGGAARPTGVAGR
jgi:hypothetical protein